MESELESLDAVSRLNMSNSPSDNEEANSQLTPSPSPPQLVKLADVSGLVDLMLCSLCQTIPIPPNVLCCHEGHVCCDACVQRIPRFQCPKRIEIQDANCGAFIKPFKCGIFEYLYWNSRFRCSFGHGEEGEGCQEVMLGSDVKTHRKICPFRGMFLCPFTACVTKKKLLLSVNGYVNHLTDTHKVSLVQTKMHKFKVEILKERLTPRPVPESYRWVCGLLEYFGNVFMVLAEDGGEDITIWVSLAPMRGMDLESDANDSSPLLQSDTALSCEQNPGHMIRWNGEVFPFSKSFHKILSDGESLSIRKGALSKKFVYDEEGRSFFDLTVNIKEDKKSGDKITKEEQANGVQKQDEIDSSAFEKIPVAQTQEIVQEVQPVPSPRKQLAVATTRRIVKFSPRAKTRETSVSLRPGSRENGNNSGIVVAPGVGPHSTTETGMPVTTKEENGIGNYESREILKEASPQPIPERKPRNIFYMETKE